MDRLELEQTYVYRRRLKGICKCDRNLQQKPARFVFGNLPSAFRQIRAAKHEMLGVYVIRNVTVMTHLDNAMK
jgi:hypothetical protein